MLSFLTGIAVVFSFAWLSRARLDTRSVPLGAAGVHALAELGGDEAERRMPNVFPIGTGPVSVTLLSRVLMRELRARKLGGAAR